MTVQHVYAGYVVSGAEGITRNVQGLVDALERAGTDVRLAASPVRLSELNRARTHARNARDARRLVRNAFADPDVNVIHHHVNIAAMGVASRREARLRRRVILHVWNAVHTRRHAARVRGRWKHRLFNGRWAARWGLSYHNEVVVSSRFQSEQLRAMGFAGTVHVVANGIDTQKYRPPTAQERQAARAAIGLSDEPTILYYGHLSPWKGVDDVVRAFSLLSARHPRARLLIAHTSYGRGGKRLDALLQAAQIADKTHVLGIARVPDLLATPDIVVVPPVAAVGTACHPNVLLESLSAGAGVVATRVGSIPEVVIEGRTGILVPPAEPDRLADALDVLVSDEPMRRRFGAAARADAVMRFDWELAARRIQAVYARGADGATAAQPVSQARNVSRSEVESWA